MHGLVALMEIQASRARARVDASGEPILLLDQNRALSGWLLRSAAASRRLERVESVRRGWSSASAEATADKHRPP